MVPILVCNKAMDFCCALLPHPQVGTFCKRVPHIGAPFKFYRPSNTVWVRQRQITLVPAGRLQACKTAAMPR